MKKLFTLLFFVGFTAAQTMAQTRFIEVVGEAEYTVDADEITLEITLEGSKEYDAREAVSLNQLELEVREMLRKRGANPDNLKKQGKETPWGASLSDNHSRKYTLVLNNVDVCREVQNGLDSMHINMHSVKSVSSSQEAKYKEEVSLTALKNAKAKAEKMLAVYNEKLGKVLEIKESNEDAFDDMFGKGMSEAYKNLFTKVMGNMNDGSLTVKIRYSVRVKFAIL